MARYFFDIADRGRGVRDRLGMELADEAHAIHEAAMIIEQLVDEAQAEGRPGTIVVGIRDGSDACLYEASTSLAGE